MSATDPGSVDDPTAAIVAALARLRGRRPPLPGPEGWRGHPFGRGAERADDDHPRRGGPPWAEHGHGRFLGPARFRLLEALATAAAPLSVSQLAEAVGVDQPRASRLVQQAVEHDLVRREADPEDARRTRIVLTARGEAFARGFRGERRDTVREALAGFTPAEKAELARLLVKLADAWPR